MTELIADTKAIGGNLGIGAVSFRSRKKKNIKGG